MGRFPEPYLVIGAKGMLGTDLMRALADKGIGSIPMDLEEVDISQADSVTAAVTSCKPGTVINVAGFTDVDRCETMAEAAFRANALGPGNLAEACCNVGCGLVHISTDYVFDGQKHGPYSEDDRMNPLGVYGKSKAQGERHVRECLPDRHCIVRTQWLFGIHGKNFVETIIRLAQSKDVLTVVDDQFGSPTYSVDLAAGLIALCQVGAAGTIHLTNSGVVTWHGFARRILDRVGAAHVRVEPITSEHLSRPAPRPLYSVLNNSRFEQLTGTTLRTWDKALDDYLLHRDQ